MQRRGDARSRDALATREQSPGITCTRAHISRQPLSLSLPPPHALTDTHRHSLTTLAHIHSLASATAHIACRIALSPSPSRFGFILPNCLSVPLDLINVFAPLVGDWFQRLGPTVRTAGVLVSGFRISFPLASFSHALPLFAA